MPADLFPTAGAPTPDDDSRRTFLKQSAGLAGLAALPAALLTACDPAEPATRGLGPAAVTLLLNGQPTRLQVAPWTTLLDALREYAHLPGTKKGCDHGQCGSCTVLVAGKRINSCLTLAVMHEDDAITTIEGLGTADNLSPLQQAFIDHDAFQCGYCTPGQICSAQGLLNEGKATTPAEIRELMSGNLCRCGAYSHILAAVQQVVNQPTS